MTKFKTKFQRFFATILACTLLTKFAFTKQKYVTYYLLTAFSNTSKSRLFKLGFNIKIVKVLCTKSLLTLVCFNIFGLLN